MNSRAKKILLAISPVLLSGIVSGFFIAELIQHRLLFWSYDFFNWIVLPLICLLIVQQQYQVRAHEYGIFSIREGFPDARVLTRLFITTLAFLTYVPVQLTAELLLPPAEGAFSFDRVIPAGSLGKVTALYLALTAALVEEIYFRGLLKLVIVGKSTSICPRFLFVLISAVLFGVNHWAQGVFMVVAATYLGVIAALTYLKFGNLWFNVSAHFIVNLLASFSSFFPANVAG